MDNKFTFPQISNVSELSTEEKEDILAYACDNLKLLCLGRYLSFETFLLDDAGNIDESTIEHFVDILLSQHSFVSSEEPSLEREVYRYFYKASLYFLISTCNREDLVFKSIELLAGLLDRVHCTEEFDYDTPFDTSAFFFLFDTLDIYTAPEELKPFVKNCILSFQKIRELYIRQPNSPFHSAEVKSAIDKFLTAQGYNCISDNAKFEKIATLLQSTIDEISSIVAS